MIARLVLVMSIVLIVLVMCGGRAPAAECVPEAAVEAAMSETAAANDGIRYRIDGQRAIIAVKIISAIATRPTPPVDTIHAVHMHEAVVVAFAHQGQVCGDAYFISRSLWRRVLETVRKAA